MADDLDSLVKGAPTSGSVFANNASPNFASTTTNATTTPAAAAATTSPIAASTTAKANDPLSHTPSSPSMIYLNLLILEASLRAQYLALRARRRHHTFFLTILSAWILGFGYALFLAPREDGSGVGGSVYWVVDVTEKVCFMGGVITAALVWATGIWERGVRWPRRWFSTSNRGLRHINCKLILLKRPWYAEALATVIWFLTYGLFSNTGGSSSYRYVEPALLREVDRELHLSASGHQSITPAALASSGLQHELHRDEEKGGAAGGAARFGSYTSSRGRLSHGHEEDLAPGGDFVMLLLLAKPFSPTFRENWELYRQEYWDRENERRALIRQKLKEQDRTLRKSTGSWFWWMPWRASTLRQLKLQQHQQQLQQQKAHHLQHPRHAAVEREHRRTRSSSSRRSSMSMVMTPSNGGTGGAAGSSRSSTPTRDLEDPLGVARKSSTGSNASDRRRSKKSSLSGPSGRTGSVSGSAAVAGKRPSVASLTDARSATPETPSPLAKASMTPSDTTPAVTTGKEGRRGSSRLQ